MWRALSQPTSICRQHSHKRVHNFALQSTTSSYSSSSFVAMCACVCVHVVFFVVRLNLFDLDRHWWSFITSDITILRSSSSSSKKEIAICVTPSSLRALRRETEKKKEPWNKCNTNILDGERFFYGLRIRIRPNQVHFLSQSTFGSLFFCHA